MEAKKITVSKTVTAEVELPAWWNEYPVWYFVLELACDDVFEAEGAKTEEEFNRYVHRVDEVRKDVLKFATLFGLSSDDLFKLMERHRGW